MKKSTQYILIGTGFGLFAWIIDAIVDYQFFNIQNKPLLDHLIINPHAHEIYIRLVLLATFTLFGFISARQIEKQTKTENHITAINKELGATLFSIGDAVISTDTHGKIARMNPIAQELTAWDISEAKGKPLIEVFKIINAHTRATAKNPVDKALKENKIVGLANHTVLIDKNGKEYQIADSAAPITNKENVTIGVVLVFRDVTEEYQMRDTIEKSEKQLSKAQAITKTGSWEFHLNTGQVVASDQAYKIYGTNPDKKLTIKDAQSFPLPEFRPMMDQAIKNLIEKDEKYDLEFKIKQQNTGKILDVQSIAEYDKRNNIVFGTIKDITEQKRTRKELKESEASLQSIFRSAPVGIGMVVNRILVDVNQRVCEMTGYSKEELLNKSARILYPNDKEYDFVGQEKYQQITQQGTGTVETLWQKKNGEVINVLLSSTPIQSDDWSRGVTFTALDITERKKYEVQIKQKNEEYYAANEELRENLEHIQEINKELEKAKEKAEESEKLKSAFLANMSHEIRTPMNSILGFAQMLKKPALSDTKQRRYIKIIDQSGRRMLNTINDLVDIAKIEANQMKITTTEFEVHEEMIYLHNLFSPEAQQKKLKLKLVNPLDNSLKIKTDKEKLEAVLINLIKNAIKYTDEGYIEFGYKTHANEIMFFVKDTGIGIDPKRHKAIFERFVQADIEDKEVREGTGLGLAITKAYVEMLGGEIRVASEPDKGSTFSFHVAQA